MNRYGENTVRAHHESRFMRQWCTQLRAQGEIRSNTMKTELSVIKKKKGEIKLSVPNGDIFRRSILSV